jgi:ribulose-phosphate 3-epimerase
LDGGAEKHLECRPSVKCLDLEEEMVMNSPKKIAPSILSADFANLAQELNKLTEAGADWIHVDVMDGHFVPNLTIGAPVVQSLRRYATIPLDVHLMVDRPEDYVDAFAKAGADYFTFHIEATTTPAKLIAQIKDAGMKPGISLRPKTPISMIEPYLADIFLALVMTVEPGFGGQSFMHDQVQKIRRLYELRSANSLSFLIEVDGGVTDETIQHCSQADVLVAGSYVFKRSYKDAIATLKGN